MSSWRWGNTIFEITVLEWSVFKWGFILIKKYVFRGKIINCEHGGSEIQSDMSIGLERKKNDTLH